MGIDSAACETITVLGVRRGGTISTHVVINPFLMGSLIMWWMCKRWICTSASCKSYFHIAKTAQTIWGEIDLSKRKWECSEAIGERLEEQQNLQLNVHNPLSRVSVCPTGGMVKVWSRWMSPIRIQAHCTAAWSLQAVVFKKCCQHNHNVKWKYIVSSNPIVQEE